MKTPEEYFNENYSGTEMSDFLKPFIMNAYRHGQEQFKHSGGIKFDRELLRRSIVHILDSGVNEIRLMELFENTFKMLDSMNEVSPVSEQPTNELRDPSLNKDNVNPKEGTEVGVRTELRDSILNQYEAGNIVVAGIEGLQLMKFDDFMKQPVDGILYDLNRGEETILCFIKDAKWVNDYAATKVIRRLWSDIESLREEIERLKANQKELVEALKELIKGAAPQTHSMTIEKAQKTLSKFNP